MATAHGSGLALSQGKGRARKQKTPSGRHSGFAFCLSSGGEGVRAIELSTRIRPPHTPIIFLRTMAEH